MKRAVALLPVLLALGCCHTPARQEETEAVASMPTAQEATPFDRNFPKIDVERAGRMSEDQAKAILVARAAIEADSPHAELRFEVMHKYPDWHVRVLRILHQGRASTMQMGIPTVVIGPDSSVKEIRPGY